VLGYAPTSYAAGLRLELVHPDDLDHVNSAWELVLASPDRSVDVIYRARSADGRWIWLDTVLTNHLDDPAIEGVVYNASDVTEQKRLEMDLRHLALHDPLTGLSNRVRFNDRLAERIRRLAVSDHPAAVLFLDLDRFKIVNDTLGHAVGDSLLQALVERIQSALAPQDLLARFGGDEFVAILDHVSDENGAFEVADRVIAALERPFEWNGHRLIVGSSIGVAMVRPGRTPDQVLRDADTALYHAKSAGRGRAVLYTEELMSQSGRRHRIGAELRRAVERAELFLEYQPIVRLSDQACIAHEALARWRHPEFGAISPAEFIPIAEETGAIEPIGAWIIDDACRRLAAWTPDGAVISLNLSAVQMRNSALAPQILSCLEAHGIDPARLQIELTESTLIDDLDQACATLERLRHHGVSVAIDDFGSGYSSLLYLRDLPIDSIKLDCRFIQGIGTRAGSVAIIEAIVALAHTLGLSVTGEGIETAEQLEFLRGIGCDAGQGYYLGRPALPGQRPPQSVSLPSSAEQSDPWAFPRVPRIVVPSARP
jgi:diguanylate cyclase (GGDEF)-like protein/PAS domain S-box-containing protein